MFDAVQVAIEDSSFFTLNGFISFLKASFLSYLSVGWKSLSYSHRSGGTLHAFGW
jgi:hypothetical protein